MADVRLREHVRGSLAQGLTLVERSVQGFQPQSRTVGAARTVIALGQLVLLVLTPASHYFVPVLGQPLQPVCDSVVRQASLYCLMRDVPHQTVSWIAAAALVVVASGFLPRYTSVLHFWIALSVNQSISLPDGGEAVAQVVTLLLVLVSCNDRRTWHWQRPADVQHRDSVWQGIGWAGHWGLRLQMAYIYLNASVAKTAVDDWSDGTALYYVFRGEYFGARGLFSQVFLWISANPFGALALAWGTILGEGLIALFILGGRRRQRLALALSLLLHVGIIVGIGLWTFGLIMIGGILAAAAPSLDPPAADGRPGPARPEPDPERVEEPAQVLSSA